ncbi:MAG: alkaline phosphatase family protein [Polyangiales bacterium]
MAITKLARSGAGVGWVVPGLLSACAAATDEPVGQQQEALAVTELRHVIVIAMENHDANQIYGNSSAPYINGVLLPAGARGTDFNDELPLSAPSEPHYLWMEGGTHAYSDHTFNGNADPSASNSTASVNHLSRQIKDDDSVTWRTYQEGLNSSTGRCPIHSSGFYAAKHNPFVFFQDIAGDPPSADNDYCVSHHRPYSALAADVAAGDVASFTFITPNLCNDMHGASGCPDSNQVRSGDTWLSHELPRLIEYVEEHAGVIFVTWDEGSATLKMPFIALGPTVKPGYTGSESYTHASVLKSTEHLLGLPTLPRVAGANDLSDLFESYP